MDGDQGLNEGESGHLEMVEELGENVLTNGKRGEQEMMEELVETTTKKY